MELSNYLLTNFYYLSTTVIKNLTYTYETFHDCHFKTKKFKSVYNNRESFKNLYSITNLRKNTLSFKKDLI